MGGHAADRAPGDVDAVVLAAGFGKRLRPLTDDLPKALVPFFGVPLLDHVLARLAGLPRRPRRVAINLHHLPDAVVRHVGDGSRHGLAVTYSLEAPDILGTGGALRRLEGALAEQFLVVNGDVWLDAPLERLGRALDGPTGAAAAVGLVRDPERRDLELVAVASDDDRILSIGGRPAPAPPDAPRWIFAGAHAASRSLLSYLPADGFACVVRDGYVRQLAAGERLVGCPFPDATWHDVGTPESYLRAHRALFPRLGAIVRHLPTWRCREVAPGVFVAPGARIADGARLVAPVLVDDGARLEDGATAGPATVVGEGAVLRSGVRVSRGVVWEYSEVKEDSDEAIHTVVGTILTGDPSNR